MGRVGVRVLGQRPREGNPVRRVRSPVLGPGDLAMAGVDVSTIGALAFSHSHSDRIEAYRAHFRCAPR